MEEDCKWHALNESRKHFLLKTHKHSHNNHCSYSENDANKTENPMFVSKFASSKVNESSEKWVQENEELNCSEGDRETHSNSEKKKRNIFGFINGTMREKWHLDNEGQIYDIRDTMEMANEHENYTQRMNA